MLILVERSFAFWDDLKAYAEAYALSSRALPPDNAAYVWINRHLRLAFLGEQVPREAFDFYLHELENMVGRARTQRLVEEAASLVRDPL